MDRIRSRLTYANIVSTLALFVAIASGGAYAARTIDGVGGKAYKATIPSGKTVRGVFACNDSNEQLDNAGPGLLSAYCWDAVNLPAAAPEKLTDSMVNFAPSPDINGDEDASCTGTIEKPTAPRGKVCLYQNSSVANLDSVSGGAISGAPSKNGFVVFGDSTAMTSARAYTYGTWAYRAP
jgi:hypothetical protein